jgi:hypothetical protein
MIGTKVRLKNRRLAALLAFLVPGLGHAYQGRYGKAALYAICILGLFFIGMALGDWKILYWRWVSPVSEPERFCYWYFWQALTGIAALPSLIQSTLQLYGFPTILWGYGAEPSTDVLNGLYPRYGKIVDIGYIYTQAAGLLNILAIYDAYEGPALKDEPSPPSPPSSEVPPPSSNGPEVAKVEAAV